MRVTTFSFSTLTVTTFSTKGIFARLSITTLYHFAECCYTECLYADFHYAVCHYAEYRYTECHYGEFHYTQCHYAEFHYAECRCAECRYEKSHCDECHGAKKINNKLFLLKQKANLNITH